ncbi:MAG: HAD hydrolase-like protein [Rhodocyclaceae bacterium]|nr:HAD hydrolase-like protein [Rhodocyclaceae bacterium]
MTRPRYSHVLFDLDGTLIDSAPAILASFRQAFTDTGVPTARAIGPEIIGPPLMETLTLLSGSDDAATLERLAGAFKASYDTTGYRATAAYDGVAGMLQRLRGAGCRLHIATNKRIHPTRLILAHLGWDAWFDTVYALDIFKPPLPNKAAMIARLMSDRGIDPADAVYVGDRPEDGESADANALPFFAANWGYGSLTPDEMRAGWTGTASPEALASQLEKP